MAIIRGTSTNTKLIGTSTKDWIYGFLTNDSIDGGAGNDFLSGGNGNDTVFGSTGHDKLYGGFGIDNLDGGIGNDFLDGGLDTVRDILKGGDGDDTAVVYDNDSALGGSGLDILSIGSFDVDTAIKYTLNLSKINGSTATAIGHKGITAGQFEGAYVYMGKFLAGSSVIGSAGEDEIIGGWNDTTSLIGATLDGGAGDDIILGTNKNDSVLGGAGYDQLAGGDGADTLTGGTGADQFVVDLSSIQYLPPKVDIITDFSAEDFFLVDPSPFYGYMASTASNVDQNNPLEVGSTPKAKSTKAQFLYDTDDGRLFYDADGTGSKAAIHLYTLKNKPVLNDLDFIV